MTKDKTNIIPINVEVGSPSINYQQDLKLKSYDSSVVNEILRRITNGQTLAQVFKDKVIDKFTYHIWKKHLSGFSRAIDTAKKMRAEILREQLLEDSFKFREKTDEKSFSQYVKIIEKQTSIDSPDYNQRILEQSQSSTNQPTLVREPFGTGNNPSNAEKYRVDNAGYIEGDETTED